MARDLESHSGHWGQYCTFDSSREWMICDVIFASGLENQFHLGNLLADLSLDGTLQLAKL